MCRCVDRKRLPNGGNVSWNPAAGALYSESLSNMGQVPGLVSPNLPDLFVPANAAGRDVETARWKRAYRRPAQEQRLVFLGSGGKNFPTTTFRRNESDIGVSRKKIAVSLPTTQLQPGKRRRLGLS